MKTINLTETEVGELTTVLEHYIEIMDNSENREVLALSRSVISRILEMVKG